MALRFRQRIKVLPGIYLNLGKNGISTTIGPREANINIGKQGVYLNTGLPGTGISNRQKLFGNKNNPENLIEQDKTSPINGNNSQDSTQDIVTSEGLTGLKEQLEAAKNERELTAIEVKETKDKLVELQSKLLKMQTGLLSKLFIKKEVIENVEKEVNETSQDLIEIRNHYEENKADINILLEPELEEQFEKLNISFGQLTKCDKIWDITEEREVTELKSSAKSVVERKEVKFGFEDLDFIKSKHSAFCFQNANGSNLYFYPGFILLMDKQNVITLVDLKDLHINFIQQKFQESANTIPTDSKIIDYNWAKINKDGSRDMRLKGNYQIPIVKYGALHFESRSGINETYHISDVYIAQNFANELEKYLDLLNPHIKQSEAIGKMNIFSKKYYDLLIEFSKQLTIIINKLSKDEFLIEKIKDSLNGIGIDKFFSFCVFYDLWQILKILCKYQYTKESLEVTGVVLLSNKILKSSDDYFKLGYEIVAKGHSTGVFKDVAKSMEELAARNNPLEVNVKILNENQVVSAKKLQSNLSLPSTLKILNDPLFDEYATTLYRFATIIAKADDIVSKDEEEILKEIYKLIHIPLPEDVNNSLKISDVNKNESLNEVLNELDTLIGLEGVKQEVKSLINYIKIQKEREKVGLKSSQVSYHCVFTGSPGTGKTTIARIVAKIYMHLGILKKGHLVETDRSGLVAEYSGQTAVKVNKTVNSAIDGVLFIDEAYSLVGENQDDFGKEAVATLIKRMEDDRDKLIVILAGYTNEMKTFIESNPGFKSRFNRYIEFVDYAPNDLESIFKLLCTKLDYNLNEGAENKLRKVLKVAFTDRDKSFGNGRYVRNLFEKTLEEQANRIAAISSLTKEVLTTILEEDIPEK